MKSQCLKRVLESKNGLIILNELRGGGGAASNNGY